MIHSRTHSDRDVSHLPQTDPEHRVLPFKPRGSLLTRRGPQPSPVQDLGKYERAPEEPDDFRHRMLMNGFALVATIGLVLIGLWLATTMAQMRKDQDCVLAGRHNCTTIPAPLQSR